MPDYHSPFGPPPFKAVTCDNLFELLIDRIDKPHEYTHIIAELLCLQAVQGIVWQGGVPYLQDPGRSKTLSIPRETIRAGDYGLGITDRYLSMDDVPSAGFQGYPLPRPATITGMWAKSRGTVNWVFEVRRNAVELTVASIAVNSGSGSAPNLDIDLDQGDIVQVYANGTGIDHPLACIELAWRIP